MSTALYRRYRPETFEDVIGQEHVTNPLMTALQKNRVNHAYLFSGPRGCGKTTSARILARCLNCEQGPTAHPCGTCESCIDLSRDGAGSLDVIEMDAASHGGVDHARDLRERATFAPVRDRYKIFIIDEAHMVTREGFNALLKIVEEPPEHIKFIFATTEPNKVLGTIRSRTHHYPFRLVAPEVLRGYLNHLCDEEGIRVDQGVLPLVVRAGGGSVRDSLSVLDQLMAGASAEGISYDLAVALLGFTHAELLDGVVDAFAAGDSPAVFHAVDRVVQTGQDPRRFVEDLLERFRDLIIVKAVPDSAAQILHGMPEDQIDRMRGQANQLGASELSRSADIANTALTEMTGATSPQLHLELLCARILLPTADDSSRGVNARVDRLERRINMGSVGAVQAPLQSDPAAVTTPETPAEHVAAQTDESNAPGDASQGAPGQSAREAALSLARKNRDSARNPQAASDGPTQPESSRPEPSDHAGTAESPEPDGDSEPPNVAPDTTTADALGAQPTATSEGPHADAEMPPEPEEAEPSPRGQKPEAASGDSAASQPSPDAGQVNLIERSWADIVAAVGNYSKVGKATFRECRPTRFDGGVLYVASSGPGIESRVERFASALSNAVRDTLGLECTVALDNGSPGPGGSGPGGSGPGGNGPRRDGPGSQNPSGAGQPSTSSDPGGSPDDWPGEEAWTDAARRAQSSPSPVDAPTTNSARPADTGTAEDTAIPEGDRGGEEAWQKHGMPRSSQDEDREPDWSEDSSGESFDGWKVARIPDDEDAPETETEEEPGADFGDLPGNTASHLRVVPEDAGAEPDGSDHGDSGSSTPQPEEETKDAPSASPGGSTSSAQDADDAAPISPAQAPASAREESESSGQGRERLSSHDWSVAARQAGAPGAPLDGKDCGWGYSGPKGAANASEHPSMWGQRAPHLTEVTGGAAQAADQDAATVEPQQAGSSHERSRHLHAVRDDEQADDQQNNAPVDPGAPEPPDDEWENFVPSPHDEDIEDSSVFGQAAIETILGGRVLEERPHHQG